MADYFNPTSMQGAIDYKPSGALAGQLFADRENQSNSLIEMFRQSQGLDLQKKQMETNEFLQNSPYRSLEEQAKAAVARGKINTSEQSATEELRQKRLANDLAFGKMPSLIEQEALKAQKEGREEEFNQIVQDIRLAQAGVAKAKQIPGYTRTGPIPLPIISGMDTNHPMIKMANNSSDPMKALESIASTDIAGINARALQRVHNEGSLAVAKEGRESAKDVALIQERWHTKMVEMQAERAKDVKKWEQRVMELNKKSAAELAGIKGSITRAEAIELNAMNAIKFAERQAPAGVGAGTTDAFVPGQNIPVPKPYQVPIPGEAQSQGQPKVFTNEAEALKSGYKGPAIINGRPAMIN